MRSQGTQESTNPHRPVSDTPMDLETARGDLDSSQHEYFIAGPQLAWDIETSGLDWSRDSIGTCQITNGARTVIVQLSDQRPNYLADLLRRQQVQKVFHHAMFDLRFMCHQWAVTPANIACSKIASKILNPNGPNEANSLKALLEDKLAVKISKAQQRSDWLEARLSSEQLAYAATDVAHLIPLLSVLLEELRRRDLQQLALDSFAYIPTRVRLDILGQGDVFTY